MALPPDTILYAGWDVEAAKIYVRHAGLTKDDVRLVDRAGQILIISKRELAWTRTPS